MRKALRITLLVILVCLTLCSCADNVESPSAICVFDDDAFTLPVKVSVAHTAGNFSDFSTKLSLREIKLELDKVKDDIFSSELFQDKILLITKITSEKVVHYYIVTPIATDVDNGMNSYFLASSVSEWQSGELLMPFHLFDVKGLDFGTRTMLSIAAGQEYEVIGTIDEFESFYKSVDVFEVSKQDNCLEISLKAKTDEQSSRHIKASFRIEFSTNNNKQCVTYSI